MSIETTNRRLAVEAIAVVLNAELGAGRTRMRRELLRNRVATMLPQHGLRGRSDGCGAFAHAFSEALRRLEGKGVLRRAGDHVEILRECHAERAR